MGQYYIYVNYDKKEYLSPSVLSEKTHDIVRALTKLDEQCLNNIWILGYLLWRSTCAGGGDYFELDPKESHKPENYQYHIWNEDALPKMGYWAGDRVALVGDYTYLNEKDLQEFEQIGFDIIDPKTKEPFEKEWHLIFHNCKEISEIIALDIRKFGSFLGRTKDSPVFYSMDGVMFSDGTYASNVRMKTG